jgi:hypothetical protein
MARKKPSDKSPKRKPLHWKGIALVLTLLGGIYLIPTQPALERFTQDTTLVPRGDVGDQPLFVWMLGRAKRASSFTDFVTQCDWSDQQCFDLRASAQEMNMLYFIGRVARVLDVGERAIITSWYFGNLFVCLLAAFFFIWVISGNLWAAIALAGLASFQQSLVQRIQGHITLVTWWASVLLLALEWLCLLEVCAPPRQRRKWGGYLLPVLWASCFFVTVNFSFYYTAFDSVLAPSLLVAFLYVHKISFRELVRKPGFGKLAAVIGVAVLVTLLSVSWAFTGGVDAKTFYRPDYQVSLYSARFQDFFLPNVDASNAYAWLNPLHLANDPSRVGDRLEVLSYLGFTFLLGLLATLGLAWRKKSPAPRVTVAFFGLFVAAAFLTHEDGGLLVHRYAQFARCFNRVAPFAVLFGCTYMALHWRRYPRLNQVLAGLTFLMFVLEFRGMSLLSPDLLRKMDQVDRVAAEMKAVCKNGGSIRAEPACGDYMMGPVGAYYAAELAGCRLSSIRGSGAFAQPQGFVPPPVAGKLIWPGDYMGANPASFQVQAIGP